MKKFLISACCIAVCVLGGVVLSLMDRPPAPRPTPTIAYIGSADYTTFELDIPIGEGTIRFSTLDFGNVTKPVHPPEEVTVTVFGADPSKPSTSKLLAFGMRPSDAIAPTPRDDTYPIFSVSASEFSRLSFADEVWVWFDGTTFTLTRAQIEGIRDFAAAIGVNIDNGVR